MSTNETSWTKLNFIERSTIPIDGLDADKAANITWLEFEDASSAAAWILDSNADTIKFGGTFHSIYLRWNVAVNGLHKAAEIYGSEQWCGSGMGFQVQGVRNAANGSGPQVVPVQLWDGKKAAEVHKTSAPMIAAWAFCNMYACLEEFVFRLYRIYLESHPLDICSGPEFKSLRQLFKIREDSPQDLRAWETAWSERLEVWHRKRLYDGLGAVFKAYICRSGLKIPGSYEGSFNYDDVSETLAGISLIRNGFIHGAATVSKELGDFCKSWKSGLFSFKEADEFVIGLEDLASLEHFTHTLTINLNTSFFELAWPELRKLSLKSGPKK